MTVECFGDTRLDIEPLVGCTACDVSPLPSEDALMLLDMAMKSFRQEHADTSLASLDSDAFYPPESFALLLRDAFAPGMDVVDMSFDSDVTDAAREAFTYTWERNVLEPFADRYRLWYWNWKV